MLTEQRYEVILKLLEEKNSITVAEVKDLLNTSESTVRRDITALHNAGKLVKVFGGAVACDRTVITHEPTVEQKAEVNVEAKQLVAAKAAALIRPEDFIYLEAGTTTASMLSYETMDHRNGKSKKAGRRRCSHHFAALETEGAQTADLPGLPLCCPYPDRYGTLWLQLLSGGQQYSFCYLYAGGIGGITGTGYSRKR